MEEGPKYDTDKAQWYPMPLVLLEPLRGPFLLGEQKYELFSCLKRFPDSDRRFWDAMMRHLTEFQLDTLAMDSEAKTKYNLEVYHGAQAAFNILMRIYHKNLK